MMNATISHMAPDAPGMRYRAKDLNDVASYFDMLAGKARDRSMLQRTLKEARFNEGQSEAFETAARILRATTIEPLTRD